MEIFSNFVSENLIPEIKFKAENKKRHSFAVILEDGQSISIQCLEKIRERTSLSPIFFVISASRTLDISRKYARVLDERLAVAQGLGSAVKLLSEFAFTVSESISGSYISFFAGTPVYLSNTSPLSRSFIEEMKKCSLPNGIFMPYKKNRTEKIGCVNTTSSDFALATKKLRADFGTKLSRHLFN